MGKVEKEWKCYGQLGPRNRELRTDFQWSERQSLQANVNGVAFKSPEEGVPEFSWKSSDWHPEGKPLNLVYEKGEDCAIETSVGEYLVRENKEQVTAHLY